MSDKNPKAAYMEYSTLSTPPCNQLGSDPKQVPISADKIFFKLHYRKPPKDYPSGQYSVPTYLSIQLSPVVFQTLAASIRYN